MGKRGNVSVIGTFSRGKLWGERVGGDADVDVTLFLSLFEAMMAISSHILLLVSKSRVSLG